MPAVPDLWRAHPGLETVTAVCVAGEVRTLVYKAAQEHLAYSLLDPLNADVFLVLAPKHTGLWCATCGNLSALFTRHFSLL